ncbi:MAG: STAS domain-containing protein [Pseudomonadota bacterium]
MDVSWNLEGNRAFFKIQGHVDESGAERLRDCFAEMDLSDLDEVIIDFGGVTRLGSAGIGQLLLLYKKLATAGGNLRLEKVPENIWELFHTMKVETLFTVRRG